MKHTERIYDDHPLAHLFYAQRARVRAEKAVKRGDTRGIRSASKLALKATTASLRAELAHPIKRIRGI